MLGVYGKHPGFGDFVEAGFSEVVRNGFTDWLNEVLPQVRDAQGAAWEQVFDVAPELSFWIGSEVYQVPVFGVMRASRDKVGRRFPLILGSEGLGLMPPVLDPSQIPYVGLSDHLDIVKPGDGAASLIEGLVFNGPEPEELEGNQLWAMRTEGGALELLTSVSTADHLRLAQGRSYWWTEAADGEAAIMHACEGMPDAQALGWLLTGVPATPPQEAANGQ